MCGIAGIYNYADPTRPIERDELTRMTRALSHRGPDDEGFYIEGPIGLGHRRLSIVDLSETGHQPMSSDDCACWITYNGEFYNHSAFRERLVSKGCRFRGTSDTETLLNLLREDGPDALANVAGIFGFAHWDARQRRLTLARDPLGVKQVYYYDDGRRVVFASEIKALLQCAGVRRHPDPEAVNQYLHFHTPLFERTFFRDIQQLRAGEYIQVSRYGRRSRIYWSLDNCTPLEDSPDQLVEKLRTELSSVVRDQLMSDVPVGSFFSGGIDSSAIAAYASRAGKRPLCFGVHFSNQGVVDERPYQEAASKALDLELQLITLDGSSFPDDLLRLMYHQDQPVIGAAMFPMAYVSKLAASNVKVCLGGQGADELFGGYARYALTRPGQVLGSWFRGRARVADGSRVSGNLGKQLGNRRNLQRLAKAAHRIFDWESAYFENFAKVSESTWSDVFAAPEFVDRDRCRQMFHERVTTSPATDPAAKVMHWDMQTYLTGLFQQDDRMSMASGLESRVPIADPRLVKFAFRVGFDAKFRGGASKWILRQAVADVLPPSVINRRKVGFDTPAEAWMKGPHFAFVRDLLLSKQARERGLWNAAALERRLSDTGAGDWFDVLWKVVCVEAWASVFLDRQPDAGATKDAYVITRAEEPTALTSTDGPHTSTAMRDVVQEVRELGVRRTAARAGWEAKTRTGLVRWKDQYVSGSDPAANFELRAPESDPAAVANAVRPLLSPEDLRGLLNVASEATRGKILCFGRWFANYGQPFDWELNPCNGMRWPRTAHWSKVLRSEALVGDVKLTWEAARFPQAFYLARAAAFDPAAAPDFAAAVFSQIEDFVAHSAPGYGVHWNSGQEIVLRAIAWSFALQVFRRLGMQPNADLGQKLQVYWQNCAIHLGHHIEYSRDSVYNNHLISEALGLYLLGEDHPDQEKARSLTAEGLRLLDEQADVQFGADGSYIMNSHNYHRAVLQSYLWVMACDRSRDIAEHKSWSRAMERSLDFLFAHQNPADGRLPNYGANDGSMPLPLSSCEFADFRPTLQAASIVTRNERIYPPGPWDEMSAWLLGPESLRAPLRPRERKSVSFDHGGYQVLRGRSDETFATFRCGTLRERFSQIDMLHLDVWWRGHNVLADPGSYLYNGPQHWNEHFVRTGSHNTVRVDGKDQMVHLRRFKNVYLTRAKLLNFEAGSDWAYCEGEHYAFQRLAGEVVHRRAVIFVKDDLWIVIDRILGSGEHTARLHWLAGDFPFHFDGNASSMQLSTPAGLFTVSILDDLARPVPATVEAGVRTPPRGWLSRHYGHKTAVASLVAERRQKLPLAFVSVLCQGVPRVTINNGNWSVASERCSVEFLLNNHELNPASIRVPDLVGAGQ